MPWVQGSSPWRPHQTLLEGAQSRTIAHDPAALGLDDWFACDFPERRYDAAHTVFFSDCYPCRLALRAVAVNVVLEAERVDDEVLHLVRLSTGWGTR